MKLTKIYKHKYFRPILIVLVFLLIVAIALAAIGIWEKHQGIFTGQEYELSETQIEYNGSVYDLKKDLNTVLIMGLDKYEFEEDDNSYNNDQRADFLMLLVIDKKKSTYSAVHINRDTMVEMNMLGIAGEKVGTVEKQIALAHTYGNGKQMSCRNTVDAASKLLLGSKIKHYISLTMESVPILNDIVGGVEVTVLDDFTGIDDTLVKGETVTLVGEHALNYVRTRYGMDDSTNSTRMQRQRQYIEALQKKAVQRAEEDENFVIDATLQMSEHFMSDCSVTVLQDLFDTLSDYEYTGIHSIEGESVVGDKFMEFYPDSEKLSDLVVKLFYEPVQ